MTRQTGGGSGLRRRIERLEETLKALEERLVTTQAEYEETVRELREVEADARQLRPWGLLARDTGSWAAVCHTLGWGSRAREGHRLVRRRDPVLHALLHRITFSPYCVLDGVTYSR